jgi:hypothetical protein
MTHSTSNALTARYRAAAFADEVLLYHHATFGKDPVDEYHAKEVLAELDKLRHALDAAAQEIKSRIAAKDENTCTECLRLVGEDNLTEISRDKHWCEDCIAEESERRAGMAEMAADDMAHAAREKAAGL